VIVTRASVVRQDHDVNLNGQLDERCSYAAVEWLRIQQQPQLDWRGKQRLFDGKSEKADFGANDAVFSDKLRNLTLQIRSGWTRKHRFPGLRLERGAYTANIIGR
jgi:hypothetical protein